MMRYGDQDRHKNLKYLINESRKFRAYAIAPPSCINREFALKKENEIKEFLTCVIYGHDLVPRLSFGGLIQTKAAITILLSQLHRTNNGPWWVYRKAITMNKNTILEALPANCKYLNYGDSPEQKEQYDDDDSKESLLPRSKPESDFMKDVDDMVEKIRKRYDKLLAEDFKQKFPDKEYKGSQRDLHNAELWTTRFCQAGNVIFITKDEEDQDEDMDNKKSRECCRCCNNFCHVLCHSMIGNVCRCRCCLDAKDVSYVAYQANIDLFCDKMIFSQYMMPDHMPHLYLDVLQRINN